MRMRKLAAIYLVTPVAVSSWAQTNRDRGPSRQQLLPTAVFGELRQQWTRNLHDKEIDACSAANTANAEFIHPDNIPPRVLIRLASLYRSQAVVWAARASNTYPTKRASAHSDRECNSAE